MIYKIRLKWLMYHRLNSKSQQQLHFAVSLQKDVGQEQKRVRKQSLTQFNLTFSLTYKTV